MARSKKILAKLISTKDELEWIAAAEEYPGLSAQNMYPNLAMASLNDLLRERIKGEYELEYELVLPLSLEAQRQALLEKERELQQLAEEVPKARHRFMMACGQRQLKQQDIADLMGLSQSYVATLMKRGSSGEKLVPRRRTPP